MDYVNEIWKQIKGFEKYEISNYGRVRSNLNRYHNTKGSFIMKPSIDKKGYARVQLSEPTRTRMLVHRLVAQHFIPNPNNYDIVNHLDNNPSNNYVDNLEWTTYSGNLKHAQKQGRLWEAQHKGGVTSAQMEKEKALKNAESLVGTKFGNLTVIKSKGIIPKNGYRMTSVDCKCDCGNIEENIAITSLKHNVKIRCKQCTIDYRKEVRHNEIVKELTGLQDSGYTFTGNTDFYTNNKPISKQLKIESICNNCNATIWHPYPSLISKSKKLKYCPHCFKR